MSGLTPLNERLQPANSAHAEDNLRGLGARVRREADSRERTSRADQSDQVGKTFRLGGRGGLNAPYGQVTLKSPILHAR